MVVRAGGIYEMTQAPQGKAGSATDVMSLAKLKIQAEGAYTYMYLQSSHHISVIILLIINYM